MDIGTTLREAREQRGLSIEALAQITKIKIPTLRAIELNAFDQLPPGVFTRGFLRMFAREVGLDPEAIVSQYLAELGYRSGAASVGTDNVEKNVPAEVESPRFDTSPMRLVSNPRPLRDTVAIVLTAAGFCVLVFAVSRPMPLSEPPAGRATAPEPPPPADKTSAPVGTSGKSLRVHIQARAACWVSANADGHRVVYKTMLPGDTQTFAIQDQLDLRVGDAGAFAFSIDGAPGRPLGAAGQPVTVRIAHDNYRQLLANP